MAHYLIYDLGTTYFKTCLFDDSGRLVDTHRVPTPITQPRIGYQVIEVDAFLNAILTATRALADSQPDGLADVVAASFATQTNSFVLLDSHDEPLTPIILWSDNRVSQLPPTLEAIGQTSGFYHTTGVAGLSPQFMTAKLEWLKTHQPDCWREARRLCLISDLLTLWMTGQHVTEAGAAGLTGLVDIHRLAWWDDATQRLELPSSWLPRVVRAGSDIGCINKEIADRLGLSPSCRFVVGCLDQFAGAIGSGNVVPGGVSETTGTVLATVRCSERFDDSAAPGVFQGPGFNEGVWYQMVFGDISANLLEAYRNSLPDMPSYESLCELAALLGPEADGLTLDVADTKAGSFVFNGMSTEHTRGHCVHAILKAVAIALSDQVDTLCGSSLPAHIRAAGGGARSSYWLDMKSQIVGVPVVRTNCDEPTSLGAAMLAAASIKMGHIDDLAKAWCQSK